MATKKSARAKANKLEAEQRVAEVEAAMIRRMSTGAIIRHFSARWGIRERQIERYMARVREQWDREGRDLAPRAREARRDQMRASLDDCYAQSMSRREVVKDSSGNPVLGPDGAPLTVARPDTRSAIAAARLLMDLDALSEEPPKQRVEHSGSIGAELEISEDSVEALKKALAGG